MNARIICILDRSGSMQTIKTDTIGGFNQFLEDQKKVDGEASLSLVLFDHEYKMIIDSVDIQEVVPLTGETFVPRGMTALYDAVGRTISEFTARDIATEDGRHPDKTIVVILTDGLENSSKEFTRSQIKEMIEKQQKDHKWEFLYLGANQDAFAESSAIGILAKNTTSYEATPDGMRSVSHSYSASVSSLRDDK